MMKGGEGSVVAGLFSRPISIVVFVLHGGQRFLVIYENGVFRIYADLGQIAKRYFGSDAGRRRLL